MPRQSPGCGPRAGKLRRRGPGGGVGTRRRHRLRRRHTVTRRAGRGVRPRSAGQLAAGPDRQQHHATRHEPAARRHRDPRSPNACRVFRHRCARDDVEQGHQRHRQRLIGLLAAVRQTARSSTDPAGASRRDACHLLAPDPGRDRVDPDHRHRRRGDRQTCAPAFPKPVGGHRNPDVADRRELRSAPHAAGVRRCGPGACGVRGDHDRTRALVAVGCSPMPDRYHLSCKQSLPSVT